MAIISRASGVGASLIPEDYARGIIKNVTQNSAALRLLSRRRMTRQIQRMSVLTAKPTAAFVTAGTAPFDSTDVGAKSVSRLTWADLTMTAEPVAVIVIVPEHFLEDQAYDLWGEIRSECEEAIAAAIDSAVFFGTNAPTSWPASINAHATAAAGNVVTAGTGVDLAADLNNALGAVESDGFYPNGWLYDLREKATLRGLRDQNRQFLYAMRGPANTGLQNAGDDDEISARVRDVRQNGEIWNLPAYTSAMGLAFGTATGNTRYITGDFDRAFIGIRSDIRVKMLDQATLVDGSDTWNLAQRDTLAMRLVTRVAYVTSNPQTRLQPTAASRSPFAVVKVP